MAPTIHIILPSYAVMAFIGGFFALIYTYFRIDKFSVQFTDFIKLFVASAVGGFIGGSALGIVSRSPLLINNFSANNFIHIITHSGIVFYGGLFGVLLSLKIYAKLTKYDEAVIFRLIAPAIPLFHAFGRIGCFLAGCCYGKALPYHVNLLGVMPIDRIPTQLIESAFEFIMYIVLLFAGRKNKDLNLLKIYLLSYAVFRFSLEFFRGDEVRGIFLLSTSQWISIAILVYYAIKRFIKGKRQPRLSEERRGSNV